MSFNERLQAIRKNAGMTQEELAAGMNVSRQAVAKWENGQSQPDIQKLVELSEIFKLPVDRLIKEDDPCGVAPVSGADAERSQLVSFLLVAKANTYAAKAGECAPSRPASHDLRYESGDYLYIDTYLGGEKFVGEEAVWIKGVPVYSMNYVGRVVNAGFEGDFLKEALKLVPADKPYRGPGYYAAGDYSYHCKVDGDIDWYQGYEDIYCRDTLVYECYFHGGAVK